jgi:organic radical activating enzyme
LYTPEELFAKITHDFDLTTFHSISLTGGEPLLSVNFLVEFLPLVKEYTKIYLETNATLSKNLPLIKNYIDIISADIKLPSATGCDTFSMHDEFFKTVAGVETFAKIVFDNNITSEEIEKCVNLGRTYGIELVLQPKMISGKMSTTSGFCNEILEEFTKRYKRVRLIPQVHKFLDVR